MQHSLLQLCIIILFTFLLLVQQSLLQLSIIILFLVYCQCNIPYYNSLSSFCYLLLLVQHSLLQPSIIILFIFNCQCNIPYYNPLSSFCLSFIVSATFLTTTIYHHFVYLLFLVQHSLLQLSIITLFIFYCQCNIPYYNPPSSFCLSLIVSATFLTTTLYHHFVHLLLLVQHSLLQLSIITLCIFYRQCIIPYYNSVSSFCSPFIVSATFLTTTLYHHFVYLLLLVQHSLLQLCIIILFTFYCQCNIPCYNPPSSFCLSFIVSTTLLTTTLQHRFVHLLLLTQHSLLQPSIIILFIFNCQCNIPYYNSLSSFCLSFIVNATFLTTTLYHHFVHLLLLVQHSLLQLSIITLCIFYRQCNIPYYNSVSSFCSPFIVSATFLTTTLYHHFVYLLLLVQHSLLQLCIITLFTFYGQCNIPCYNPPSSFCLSFIVSTTLLTTTLQHHFVSHLLLVQHSLLQLSIIILFIFYCQCNIPCYNSVSSFCSPSFVSAKILTTTLYHHFVSRLLLVQHSLLQLSIITFFIFYC